MRAHGFTLIELLVVITIMGLAIAVVGPLAIEQLDKFRAQDQVVQVERWVKSIKHQAFLNDTSYQLNLQEHSAQLLNQADGQVASAKEFSLLQFEPQQITINQNGFIYPNRITLSSRDRTLTLEFENYGLQPQS